MQHFLRDTMEENIEKFDQKNSMYVENKWWSIFKWKKNIIR